MSEEVLHHRSTTSASYSEALLIAMSEVINYKDRYEIQKDLSETDSVVTVSVKVTKEQRKEGLYK